MKPVFFPENSQFWFETLRVFGHSAYGGGDFGEAAVVAERITPGDYDSWHDEWFAMGERVAEVARKAKDGGHRVSARDAFLRASNYYRSAEFFLHGNPDDPRILRAYDASVACFREAAALFTPPIELVEIPYEDTVLPGYFYRPDDSGAVRPTVLMFNGFDGTAEEMHFGGGAAAVERGYNVLTFDGPGQPGTRHHHGMVFRPDWEAVVGPVIDYALTRPEVDPDRIALFGNSMGGMLGPRAAAFEHRIAAVIAFDGIYDLASAVAEAFPGDRAEIARLLRADHAPEVDAGLEQAMAASPKMRWAMEQGMYVMGADTPRKFAATFLDYNLRDGVAEKITCPVLVCSGTTDVFFEGQPEELFEHLTGPKTFLEFTPELGADAHCQAGGQRLAYAQVYDWLDDTLGHRG
ncbi:alpha/beta fold hydrolase [Streptomyces sp. NPDC050610]|uniref:alpha/beta hydrolase family protein n=1 Tax=Streptomyces sp. NPDC050610 TaxID=3157097 RepID=UPI003414304F